MIGSELSSLSQIIGLELFTPFCDCFPLSSIVGKLRERAATAVVHKELDDLMHDQTVLAQIMTLCSSLRLDYNVTSLLSQSS